MSHDPTENPPSEQQSPTRNGQSSGKLAPVTFAETQQPPDLVDRPVSQLSGKADASPSPSGVGTLAPETTPPQSPDPSSEGQHANIGTKDVRSAAEALAAALDITSDVAQTVASNPDMQPVVQSVTLFANKVLCCCTCQS
jgi:hypothetical protein